MNTLRDIVRFHSDRFSPVLPELCQVNPQVYGAELAFWLATELVPLGVVTSYPESEDWGWYIEYFAESGAEFAVHCGNVEGAKDVWLLSLRRHARKWFGRDLPSYSEAAPLILGVRHLISSESSITQVDWLYGDGELT